MSKPANATEVLREERKVELTANDLATIQLAIDDWIAIGDAPHVIKRAFLAGKRAVLAEPLAAQAERLVRSILADQAPSDALVREVAAKIVRELPRGCRVETPANIQETAVLPGEPSAMADRNRPVAALIERLRAIQPGFDGCVTGHALATAAANTLQSLSDDLTAVRKAFHAAMDRQEKADHELENASLAALQYKEERDRLLRDFETAVQLKVRQNNG